MKEWTRIAKRGTLLGFQATVAAGYRESCRVGSLCSHVPSPRLHILLLRNLTSLDPYEFV